jgi:hypothetical protein
MKLVTRTHRILAVLMGLAMLVALVLQMMHDVGKKAGKF